ncbi:MAG: Hpt domain-containing protein [Phycisphaerales bacterium]
MKNDPASATPIDATELLSRCMNNPAIVAAILGSLEKQLPANLEALSGSLRGGDLTTTAAVAHALKGAAGAVGASALRLVAEGIEQSAKAKALGNAEETIADLANEVRRCLDYVPIARGAAACSEGARKKA